MDKDSVIESNHSSTFQNEIIQRRYQEIAVKALKIRFGKSFNLNTSKKRTQMIDLIRRKPVQEVKQKILLNYAKGEVEQD